MPETDTRPLTHANWTPDIVAFILAFVAGILLGGGLGVLESFSDSVGIRIFSLMVAFGVAYAFAVVCAHLELEGYRYFQQAYFLLIAAGSTYFTISLLQKTWNDVMVAKFTVLNDIGAMAGQGEMISVFGTSTSYATIIMLTMLLGFVILLPFIIESGKRRMLHWLHFLPLVIIIAMFSLLFIVMPAVFMRFVGN